MSVVIEVTDWAKQQRFYEMSDSDVKKMMTLPREDRKDFFDHYSSPVQIHGYIEIDLFLPIYTDEDWDDCEADYEKWAA